MSKKLIYSISFILSLDLALISTSRADIIGWWRFDEGSGTTAYDSSGSGNDGTIIGNPQWVTGKIGGALQFNGADSIVDIPYSPNMTPSDGTTMTAWVFPTDTTRSCIVGQFEGYGMALFTDLQLKSVIWGGDWVLADVTIPMQEWSHIAMTWDVTNNERMIFLNGELVGTRADSAVPEVQNNLGIGLWVGWPAAWGDDSFMGIIDDVQIHNIVLKQDEIGVIMKGEGYPYALGPIPEDGALHSDTWVNLSWSPGDFAVSHDVYFGENFEDVNAGAEGTFQGNQASTFFVAGFPGFAYPDGLVPGTTYYWRIDEVNDTEPNSPWKGKVWSFMVPPKTAYEPIPADGAKFIDPETDLSWTGGFGAKLHTVYFGDDFDEINNASGGLPKGTTTFDPGSLELEKTYYWRVDEFDALETHKGNIWSFTITKAGGGLKAEYFNNTTLSGEPVLTRTDPQIDFNWGNADVPGENSPDAGINVNNFSARWSGELEVDLTDMYSFHINANNGFRLWLDGRLIIDFWSNPTTSSRTSEPIEMAGGATYSIRMEYFEGEDAAIAQLFWESSTRQQQIIPSGALQPPLKAGSPGPFNGAVDVSQMSILSWSAGDTAASHDVYFGTDADTVKNAGTASPEYKGSRNLGSENYDPGKLLWNTTYYWRIDELEDGGTIQKGNLWSFTTADFLIVDDFEAYNDLDPADPLSNRIFNAWIDGFDNPAINGSVVGYPNPPFAEQTIVHGGLQSMPFSYDNAVGKSEATLTLTYPRDWTESGLSTLVIWYIGDAANAPETMYVVLNGTAGLDNDNPNAALADDWTKWTIDLQAFGINLTNVDTITLGFGNRTNPAAGGSGMVFFDDIRLYRPSP